MTNVLLVEDDERISEPLKRVLRAEAFDVVHVAAGRPALASVANAVPDLVLLDLTLPDIDGLDVCRKLRADHPDLPVIMLTARAEEMDVIVGLNAGADDYVAKPFRLAELVACIRARLRIGQHHAENLVPAPPRRLAEADGGRLELTAQHPATLTLSLLAVRR
ncbi:MAG: response regulator [Ilumatobacter sp.]|uniref:response regulator transcription factor n=1 Tax=Ilumatobacter sp. TaxID=1967498 RepID=UPI003F6A5600|nr:response regulator [Ilumatobacter sp.]